MTSLGADEEKIILSGSAMANKFNLLDVSRNTPGSAASGKPTTITYQQVSTFIFRFMWLKIDHGFDWVF